MAKPKSKRTRREFLKGGLGAAVAAGCFTTDFIEGLAAQKTTKPLLTPQAFNARMPAPKTAAFASEIEEAKRDFLGYLETHFNVGEGQRRMIRGLTSANVQGFNRALDRAKKDNLKIVWAEKNKQRLGGLKTIKLNIRFTADRLVVGSVG